MVSRYITITVEYLLLLRTIAKYRVSEYTLKKIIILRKKGSNRFIVNVFLALFLTGPPDFWSYIAKWPTRSQPPPCTTPAKFHWYHRMWLGIVGDHEGEGEEDSDFEVAGQVVGGQGEHLLIFSVGCQ